MVVIIEDDDIFIDFKQEICEKSLDKYHKEVKKAAKFGCSKLMLNLERIKDLDNIFLDFILSLKNSIPSISLYNVDINLLPAFYLMKLDQIANFYTSEYDAINDSKPIIKRRFQIIPKLSSMFLSMILVSTNIT